MTSSSDPPEWTLRVNAEITRQAQSAAAAELAARFGLEAISRETLYDDFDLTLRPGEITAVVGPSGSGKSVLLRAVAEQVPDATRLVLPQGQWAKRPAIDALTGGASADRLALLSRCGLAEATALVTPAGKLSGGQQYRLALARVLHRANRSDAPTLVLADEFCSTLDEATAAVLCRQVRKLIAPTRTALLLATPRSELLPALQPDHVIIKPLGEPPRPGSPRRRPGKRLPDATRWPIEPGRYADYKPLARFHYLAGKPALIKRVYVIRTPQRYLAAGAPGVAAAIIVSPPVIAARGRNVATFDRYVGGDRSQAARRLNREVETLSRVVVHPTYRGCGLAVRLVRHAIEIAATPLVEAFAAMGKVHPLFVRAGMQPVGLFKGHSQYYHYYLAHRD
jgi:ABC-type ATPase with predicted acetyltransferase domain